VLDDIGSLPYALVRPMLLKVDNPEKLVSATKDKRTISYSLSRLLHGDEAFDSLMGFFSSDTALNGAPLPTPRRRRPRTMARLHQTRHPTMGNL